jgi:hypothetical protein
LVAWTSEKELAKPPAEFPSFTTIPSNLHVFSYSNRTFAFPQFDAQQNTGSPFVMFDDAANAAIRDMETAGIDIITDGEVRRLDGYVDSYYAVIKGIEPLPIRRKAGPWGYDQQTRYEAVGRIETPPGGLGIVKEFEYLRARTTHHTKATCAGPLTFGSRIHPGKLYKGVVDVAERFAEVINEELHALVAAGADVIQLDEPARGNVSGEEMARLWQDGRHEAIVAKLRALGYVYVALDLAGFQSGSANLLTGLGKKSRGQ